MRRRCVVLVFGKFKGRALKISIKGRRILHTYGGTIRKSDGQGTNFAMSVGEKNQPTRSDVAVGTLFNYYYRRSMVSEPMHIGGQTSCLLGCAHGYGIF